MRIGSAVIVLILAGLLGFFVWQTTSGHSLASKYPTKLGLDLAGGTELVYKADTSGITTDKQGALNSLRDIVDKRVNLFGVAEPLVQLEKSSSVAGPQEDRLLVELPGVTDVKAAVDSIGKTPVLEFKLLGIGPVTTDGVTTLKTDFQSTGLTGRYLKSAELQFGSGSAGGAAVNEPIVVLHFNDEGAALFEKLTTENVGNQMAIFLDGAPISTPTIKEPIAGGTATITGQFSPAEARDLVRNLNYGALPVPITLMSSDTVGATLGGSAFSAGLMAGVIGFLLVALFMVIWYRLPGLVAIAALVIYIIVNVAFIKLIPITLTASGIAGFIISIGMAVDANVLIFERMKEEIRRGIGPREAMHIGFGRAWPAIRDGHLTMIISSVILFWLGTSIVQGFALVFGLGVITSLLTAVFVSRIFLLAILPEENTGVWKFLTSAGFRLKPKTT